MGNSWPRLCREEAADDKAALRRTYRRSSTAMASGERWNRMRSRPSSRRDTMTESSLQELDLAAAFLLKQNRGLPFGRSSSTRNVASKHQQLTRSSSSTATSLTDPLLHLPHSGNQDRQTDVLESNHFVLVHGGGFGAWCWYKSIALLEAAGFKVDAVDLAGSGIDSVDANSITSLSEYAQPLSHFLAGVAEGDKVILVGHDFGGTCISYAMEKYYSKIAKAVFISAVMPKNGQSALDMFSMKDGGGDSMARAHVFLYANGKAVPPTSIELKKSLLKSLLFNQSPSKDVALASVSMRPLPFAPVLEKCCLSDEKYGSVRRFYVQTVEDNAIPFPLQQSIVESSPPEKVFCLKGSDHSPFFSRPQTLHKLLVQIAKIPQTPVP